MKFDAETQTCKHPYFKTLILLCLLLSACKEPVNLTDTAIELSSCNVRSEKQELLQIMQQWYLWNDEAEQANKYNNINLDAFASDEELLDFLRYRPNEFDRGFSFITSPDADAALFGSGQFIGFGFSLIQGNDSNTILVSQVFAGGPAANAGIERGYQLQAIGGRSIATINAAEGVSNALGPNEIGISLMLSFADRTATPLTPVMLSKELVTIDPVPLVSIIRDNLNQPIAGYLILTSFISTADQQLRDAFAVFTAEGVNEIIVDLRYNGGGLISTATTLGSLMAGPGNIGNVFSFLEFNSANSTENTAINFLSEPNAITLNRVVFITTGRSASASELVINALEPYFNNPNEIIIIGETTFGKPVGQSAFNYCANTKRLRPIAFRSNNVLGQGDYFNGLTMDCAASDDLTELLGDENEAMLANAIDYIENDACPNPVITTASAKQSKKKSRMLEGNTLEQRLFGAY